MGKIILLDEHTANKIAAGEVVERPASVVKELIENSIDAGSTRIEVSITDGGINGISVADNGSGMDAGDARLSFERHATSKIKSDDDLNRIMSLGFRGEALPSIAAVSRLSMKTKTQDNVLGAELLIEGGNILKIDETGCPNGTVIDVRDIFYNTPARKKHLKSPTVEAGHVSDVVNKFAMGYPKISFQLKSNGRVVLKTSGKGDLLECIAGVYGTETARDMLVIEAESKENILWGYIGKPTLSRSGRNHQTIYINGRYVRSRPVSDAVELAYHGMLMTGRHPVFVININMDPEMADVNVHPAKTEIRLAGTSSLTKFIVEAVKGVLSQSRLIPEIRAVPSSFGYGKSKNYPENDIKETKIQEEISKDFYYRTNEKTNINTERLTKLQPEQLPEIAHEEKGFPEITPVGQIDKTYIVGQGRDGMYLIDQHAAHERALYEEYMAKPRQYTASEQMLFPTAIQLTHQETQLLNDNIVNLTDIGFVIEHFGGDSFLLRAVPAGISQDGGREIFLDLLDYFSRNRYKISEKELREKFIITMACRNAIKAGQRLGLPEMESLIERLSQTVNPYTCPHGRPTLIHFSGYDLEKKFKRIV